MQSHTVPKKLLEQFAYYDRFTKSLRLWRYKKGRTPYAKASPKTATRIDGHFWHPDNPTKETELETRLNDEFENPVNRFLFEIAQPGYVETGLHRRQLTLYVTLLFLRSEGRRKASGHNLEVSRMAVEKFLKNKRQLQTVAANWSIDLLLSGRLRSGLVTPNDVIRTTRSVQADMTLAEEIRRSYVRTLENAMQEVDERLLTGQWNYLRTVPESPFVISDAPVVTWERLVDGTLSYGLGFHRPNVEVFLPISPLVCLHILPNVERTRNVVPASVAEINAAQAAFASRYCFTNANNPELDQVLQPAFGMAELGVKSFTIWHRNYDESIYAILMNNGRFVPPPRL